MGGDTITQQDNLILRRFEDAFPPWLIVVPVAAAAILFLLVMLQRQSHAQQSFLSRLAAVCTPPWAVGILVLAAGAFAFIGYQLVSLVTWWLLLVPVLAIGLTYVGIMYFRDARSVHPAWASVLAVLRTVVYLILAFVFLLPASQQVKKEERRSRVALLFDVSASMQEVDDVAEDGNLKSLLMRQEKILKFLGDDRIAFIDGLLKNNPVTCYRFGKGVYPIGRLMAGPDGTVRFSPKEFFTPDEEWEEWSPARMKKELADRLIINPNRKGIDPNQARVESDLFFSTNLGGAVRQVLDRHKASMLQGLIVFSDGQSNQEEDTSLRGEQIYEELREDAKRSKVPILCVGVGKFKPSISIRVGDIEAPTIARPDEPFPVNVPVIAQGLKGKPYEVILEISRIRDAEDKPVSDAPIVMPKSSTHKEGEPDRVEFQIDVVALKNVNPAQLTSANEKERKEALGRVEGTWELKARVARDKREAFAKAFHTPEQPLRVKIMQKKLRVLLFAGGPSKEYQFTRVLLQREVQANRMELGVYLQTSKEEEIDLGRPDTDWKLDHFPVHRVRPSPKEMPYTLFEYDAIVALDPDWGALQKEELSLIKEWVQNKNGGLVMVAGPINTYQLRELGEQTEPDDLTPIRDLCPLILLDSRLQGLGEGFEAAVKFPLRFEGPLSQFDFMKLDEDGKSPIAGWNEFFYASPDPKPSDELENGFYSYYPVKRAKSVTTILATFPARAGAGAAVSAQPFIAVMTSGSGKVVYIGALEMWQLRNYKEIYHQHFWVKLVRFAGSGNVGQVQKFGEMNIADKMDVGDKRRAEYRLRGPDGKLLGRDDAEKHKLQVVVMPFKKADDAEPDPDPTTWSIFPLKGKPGAKNEATGWFLAEFPIEQPGRYQLRLAHGNKYVSRLKPDEKNELKMKIPGTEEELVKTILVTQPNPEMDNKKPDLVRLYNLASDNEMVLPRIADDLKKSLRDVKGPIEEGAPTKPRDGRRLYFDLDSARLIPELMIQAKEEKETKGHAQDWRNTGMELGLENMPTWVLVLIFLAVMIWFVNILVLQREFNVSGATPSGELRFALYMLAAIPGLLHLSLLVMWAVQGAGRTQGRFQYPRVLLQLLAVAAVAGGIFALWYFVTGPAQLEDVTKLSYFMGAIVLLLSLEWLTRKLLRLA
jgi:hypothetical protein